jgi:F0F1-type ATP synthase membrane subunit b/b'
MSTGLIIAIVIAALILLALFWFVGRKGRERRLETRREQAREIGREADLGRAEADRTRAEAEAQGAEARRQSAEARRQDALARERAAEAEEQRLQARERHIEAAKKHPDMDEDEAAAEFDRQHPARDDTRYEGGAISHEERTETPDMERERRFERNEQGEVVRDEEYEEPRR